MRQNLLHYEKLLQREGSTSHWPSFNVGNHLIPPPLYQLFCTIFLCWNPILLICSGDNRCKKMCSLSSSTKERRNRRRLFVKRVIRSVIQTRLILLLPISLIIGTFVERNPSRSPPPALTPVALAPTASSTTRTRTSAASSTPAPRGASSRWSASPPCSSTTRWAAASGRRSSPGTRRSEPYVD